jgi:hypothetical protein
MKIILLVGILLLSLVNISAEKTITCKADSWHFYPRCHFGGVTVGPDETISVETDPADAKANKIVRVVITDSSIYSFPAELFTKFPKLKKCYAWRQNIHEIKPDTFEDAKKLEEIYLWENALTFLHADTFKGEFFYQSWIITFYCDHNEYHYEHNDFNYEIIQKISNFLRFFKGLRKLTVISLWNNKISALDPKMFSHLRKLNRLLLTGNSCISENFDPVYEMATVEGKLAECGAGYALWEQRNSGKKLSDIIYQNQEN